MFLHMDVDVTSFLLMMSSHDLHVAARYGTLVRDAAYPRICTRRPRSAGSLLKMDDKTLFRSR